MNLKSLIFSGALVATSLLFSCGGNKAEAEAEKAKQDSIAKAEALVTLSKELTSSYDHDGKTIEMEGRIKAYSTAQVISDGRFKVQLVSNDAKRDELIDCFTLALDKTPNGIFVPTKYTNDDIIIYDKDLKEGGVKNLYKLTAKVKYPSKGPKKARVKPAQISDEQWARIHKGDDTGMDYSFDLEDVVITQLD